jgi:hypothetical protein
MVAPRRQFYLNIGVSKRKYQRTAHSEIWGRLQGDTYGDALIKLPISLTVSALTSTPDVRAFA